jgi:hypothetical protein
VRLSKLHTCYSFPKSPFPSFSDNIPVLYHCSRCPITSARYHPDPHSCFRLVPFLSVFEFMRICRSRYIAQRRHSCSIYRVTYIPPSTLPLSRFHLFIHHTSITLFILHFISFLVYALRSVGHMSESVSWRILGLIMPREGLSTVRHYMLSNLY